MFIYKITNHINGKVYVGKTHLSNVKDRWKGHLCSLRKDKHINKHFQAAWNKYGEQSFTFEVIEQFNPEMNFDLNNLEKHWIIELDSANSKKGYNKTLGGDGGKHTEETRKRCPILVGMENLQVLEELRLLKLAKKCLILVKGEKIL